MPRRRKARVADIAEMALALPGVSLHDPDSDNPVYQVSRKSFIFFRTPRPDALDEHGERLTDVIVFWVGSEEEKSALINDNTTPFFTTPHFDGHPSVLLRASRIGELDVDELREVVTDAWLSRAPKRTAAARLADQGLP